VSRARRARVRFVATLGMVAALGLGLGWLLGRPAEPSRTAVRVGGMGRSSSRAIARLSVADHVSAACEGSITATTLDATAWTVAVRCLEGRGWQALRAGRAAEAITIFREGLIDAPEAPSLLRGLGLAAVHAGRPGQALAPLERAVRAEDDPETRLLLAHLYDRRDDPEAALAHLRAILEREPAHEAARRLLAKIERERQAEAGFERIVTPRFVVKSRGVRGAEARRAVVAALETAAARVAKALAFAPADRLTVVLYERGEFQQVTGVHGWATGLFDGKIRLPLPSPLPPERELERLVVHEYAHAAIHQLSRGHAPRWLHEGLAQALEGAQVDPMLRVPGSLTLTGLEALVGDADPVRARAGYDIALWVVQDLLDRGGIGALRELLVRLGAGESLADATPRVYGVRVSQLEREWQHLLGG
jgi:hypothetical protein